VKIKSTDTISNIASWFIFAIELCLTSLFLWGFSNKLLYQIPFAVGAVIFECLHFVSLIKMKTYWNEPGKKIKYFIAYILAASFTVFAAIQFSGKTIVAFSQIVEENQTQVITVKDQIDYNKRQIKILEGLQITYLKQSDKYSDYANKKILENTNTNILISTVDRNNIANADKAKKEADRLNATNKILVDQYNIMLTNKTISQKAEANDSFQFFSDMTGINKRWIIFALLLLFFVAVEYFFYVSAPTEEKDSTFIIRNQELLYKYVDVLMDIKDDEKQLNNNKVISEKTKIPLRMCKKFRAMLTGKNEEEAIFYRRNGEKIYAISKENIANFPISDIKLIIRNKIKII
jgi:hypothetical protein